MPTAADLEAGPTSVPSQIPEKVRRMVVFDDDPTGTQTVSGVDLILDPSRSLVERFFDSQAHAIYLLTNSRALHVTEAVRHLTGLRDLVQTVASERRVAWSPVLRGDSTLRGHVFEEADVFGAAESVTLLVPAFPEGGRITVGGQQLVEIGGSFINAADTEFARDSTFGYTSRDLLAWTLERGHRPAQSVPLEAVRAGGAAAVADALTSAEVGSVVVPDAQTRADLLAIAAGLLKAEAQGIQVVVRSASSFAAIRCGLEGRRIGPVPVARPGRVLIVCGSVTKATNDQLEHLGSSAGPIFEISSSESSQRFLGDVRRRLDETGVAIIATPRQRRDDADLAEGAAMMLQLSRSVTALGSHIEGVIAKGGITSGRAARALGAKIARVEGQLEAGVALWSLELPGDRVLPYAVVPGNVGDSGTLLRTLGHFERPAREDPTWIAEPGRYGATRRP